MSFHGNQFVFPLFIRKDLSKPPVTGNDELALAFHVLTKDMKEEENIMCFSKLLWPFLSIQGVISTHIILDGLYIFNKKGKFTNPPRQPLVGHILRNIDERTEVEQLNRIIELLTYKDKEAEDLGTGEESEFHTLKLETLVNPRFLDVLMKLIIHLEVKPISDHVPLDSSLTSDEALSIAERYRNVINTMKGNALRWETVSELISKEVNKWISELNVKIKDIDERYTSQITKTSSTIDDKKVREQLERERDEIDQWIVNEKKKVIENMSLLFKTADRTLEEIVKRNRFFCNDVSLKTKVYEDLLPKLESHFTFLRDNTEDFLKSIDGLEKSYEDLKQQGARIDSEAVVKIDELEASLHLQLQDRDQQLTAFEKDKLAEITHLKQLRDQFEELYRKIHDIIQSKKQNCLKEAEELKSWSIQDTEHEFFAKPIQWLFLPVYAMFIEDEDMMEERMSIVFPAYIGEDSSNFNELYALPNALKDLEQILMERIEDDMKIRSNFEFSCESKDLSQDPNLKKKILKGLSILRSKNLSNDEIEQNVRGKLNKIS